jgi:hypothetical protein
LGGRFLGGGWGMVHLISVPLSLSLMGLGLITLIGRKNGV